MNINDVNNLFINIDFKKNVFCVECDGLNKHEKITFKYKITKAIEKVLSLKKNVSDTISAKLSFREDKWTVILTNKNKQNIEYDAQEDLPSELSELVKRVKDVIDLMKDKDLITKAEDSLLFANKNLDKSKEKLDQKSMISNIYYAIQRWYFYTFTLEPSLKALKKSFFTSVLNEAQLKDWWKSSERVALAEINRLNGENLVPKEVISEKELHTCIIKELEDAYALRFQQLTGKILSEQERRFLRNEKTINEAAGRFEQIDFQNQRSKSEAEQNWIKTVDAIAAIDFPFEKLAEVSITPLTEQCLIRTWNRLFSELVKEGNLHHILDKQTKPIELFQQVRYADTYLLACQSLPVEFRQVFQEFHVLDQTKKLEGFIRIQPNALALKSLSSDNLERERKKIFEKTIRPIVDKKKQELLKDCIEFVSIMSNIKNNDSEFLKNLATEIINGCNLDVEKTTQLKLTTEELIPFLIAEFEQLGIREYHLTNEQIRRLRLYREGILDEDHLLTDAEILIGDVSKFSKKSEGASGKDFTELEIKGLQILTKVLARIENPNKTEFLTLGEKKLLGEFMKYIRKPGSHKSVLNGKLREIIQRKQSNMIDRMRSYVFGATFTDNRKYKHLPFGISLKAAELVSGITYELKDEDQFEILADKLEHLFQKIKNKQPIASLEKMTLKEIGILEKCAKAGRERDKKASLLKIMKDISDVQSDLTIDKVSGISTRVQSLFDQINQVFQEEVIAKSIYRPGDFIAVNGYRQLLLHGRKPRAIEELHFRLVTPYSHGAKIFLDEKEKGPYRIKISEVLDTYLQNKYQFFDDMYSEVWRLNISALIPESQHQKFKDVYGENWAQEIQRKYEAFENLVHRNEKNQFGNLANPWERRLNAGIADYLWGGHVRNGENDFQKLADQMLGCSEIEKDHSIEMICSEFVTKTTLAVLVKLNEELSKEIDNPNVLELPVSKKEDLSRVHPGRMIELFKKRKCISKVNASDIVRQIVRMD